MSLPSKEEDIRLMRAAIEEARKSKAENGGPHPNVGVVVVRQGKIIGKAHRGEFALGDHAEYTVLERKLRDEDLTGATLYTTLEPCNKRSPQKTPCAERVIARRIARVVIGILDPNPSIQSRGFFTLKSARIVVDMINDAKLESEIEGLNRVFIESQRAEETTHGMSELKQETALADRTAISNDFRDCRDAAITFHNCDSNNVENLLAIRYENYLRRQAKYPRIFNEAKSSGWSSQDLIDHVRRILTKPTMAHGTTEEAIREYIERRYAIDAAIIAHLELRKRYSEAIFRDELMELVSAYHTRLHKLYYDDVPFGRSDVNDFFNESHIYMLLNTPDEEDAVRFLDSYLTCALWTQLNLMYGCFNDELAHARKIAEKNRKILNKARQRKDPVKALRWRRV